MWLDPGRDRRNVVFAGLQQLLKSKGDASSKEKKQETIRRIADKHGLLKEVELVCVAGNSYELVVSVTLDSAVHVDFSASCFLAFNTPS